MSPLQDGLSKILSSSLQTNSSDNNIEILDFDVEYTDDEVALLIK